MEFPPVVVFADAVDGEARVSVKQFPGRSVTAVAVDDAGTRITVEGWQVEGDTLIVPVTVTGTTQIVITTETTPAR